MDIDSDPFESPRSPVPSSPPQSKLEEMTLPQRPPSNPTNTFRHLHTGQDYLEALSSDPISKGGGENSSSARTIQQSRLQGTNPGHHHQSRMQGTDTGTNHQSRMQGTNTGTNQQNRMPGTNLGTNQESRMQETNAGTNQGISQGTNHQSRMEGSDPSTTGAQKRAASSPHNPARTGHPPSRTFDFSSSIPNLSNSSLARETLFEARDLIVKAYTLTDNREERTKILNLLEVVTTRT
jgi:hypothetical protein